MVGRNLVNYVGQARQYTRWVWLNSASSIAAGLGVCYDRDYGTAANAEQRRDTYVELPSNTNNLAFAGVVADAWAAKNDGQGGQMVMIYEPGSVCLVESADAAVTIGDIMTCIAGGANAGKWTANGGFWGRGSARALQTITATGKILVELLDGPESGLVETVTAAAGAGTFMVGGVSHITGANIAQDMTFTLAAGTVWGQKKGFFLDTATTTQDVLITVNGVQADDATALVTAEMDAQNDCFYVEWVGDKWKLIHNTGCTLSAT